VVAVEDVVIELVPVHPIAGNAGHDPGAVHPVTRLTELPSAFLTVAIRDGRVIPPNVYVQTLYLVPVQPAPDEPDELQDGAPTESTSLPCPLTSPAIEPVISRRSKRFALACCAVIWRSGSYPSVWVCARQGSAREANAARSSPAPRIGPRVMLVVVMIFLSNAATAFSTFRFPYRPD
jgi:hypothetical protein